MEERSVIIAISAVMILIAVCFTYYTVTGGGAPFNFYSSNITLNGGTVTETLHFLPDKAYHTLYRSFVSRIEPSGNNTIWVQHVTCSSGVPYFKLYNGTSYLRNALNTQYYLPYTENNEYGCTFGDTLGFNKGTDYSITATYTINPANLFLINGTYYIKFVEYSANNHPNLKSGVNFFVNGGKASDEYLYGEDVLVYIPYKGSTEGFNVIAQNDFGFGYSRIVTLFYDFFLLLLPLILFDGIWVFSGREKKEPALPSQLSDLPNERKPWEVCAYFSPPFTAIGKSFYSTLMLDFYRRKIIDVKRVDEQGLFKKNTKTFVKINSDPENLDDVEKKFLEFLKFIDQNTAEKNRHAEYFDIDRGIGGISGFDNTRALREYFRAISKMVKEEGKKFITVKGYYIFLALIFLLFYIGYAAKVTLLIIPSAVLLFLSFMVHVKMPLLIKYNGDFYEEYMQWTAFKNGLSHLISIRDSRAEAVVLWEEYLVYATALGVADKVIKQFESLGLVDTEGLHTYSGVYIASSSFSTTVAAAGGGGGGGGVGGGGAGGGGGGGR